MRKKVTIYDLARKLNVSPATISRSLNDHPGISAKTKERVISRALKEGYEVNLPAANLNRKQSNTIGVIVPRLNSYFMSTVLSGVEKVVNEAGYNLIISQSLESMEKEKINAKTLFNSNVDALLVSLSYDTNDYSHFDPFIHNNISVIFFDRVHQLPNSSTIVIDNFSAGYDATDHLISQGCKHILHVSGNLNRKVYLDRFQGYKRALMDHKLEFRDEYLLESSLNPESVGQVSKRLTELDKTIDGIFIANDTLAAHCIRELKNLQYDIPSDIKIVGFNNDPICQLVAPTLSTIDYPGYDMGVLAAESVINHLSGNINLHSANSISLRHKLIVRESTQNK